LLYWRRPGTRKALEVLNGQRLPFCPLEKLTGMQLRTSSGELHDSFRSTDNA
jgi:hypothetical protein